MTIAHDKRPLLVGAAYKAFREISVGRHMQAWNKVHPSASAEEKQTEALRFFNEQGRWNP